MKTNSIVPCYYESTSLDDAQMPGRNARRKKVLVEKCDNLGYRIASRHCGLHKHFFVSMITMNLRSLLQSVI